MYGVKYMVTLLNCFLTYSMYFIKTLFYQKKKFANILRLTNTFFLIMIYLLFKELKISWISNVKEFV